MAPSCCDAHCRRVGGRLTASEHLTVPGRLAVASLSDRIREPATDPWPPAGWRMTCRCRPACERTAHSSEVGSRTVRSAADRQGGQAAWSPSGQPTAMVHVTRPTPRPGRLTAHSAPAPRQGLPAGVSQRVPGPGQGRAAPARMQARRAPARSSDRLAGGRRRDAGPGRGPAASALVPARRAPARSWDLPAGEMQRAAGQGLDAGAVRGLRPAEFWRRERCRQPACQGAWWPCPTSAPLTRCGWPHCSLTRSWAVGG